MTKEEILKKTCEVFQVDGDKLYYEKQVLKVMDQYGKQCFDAGKNTVNIINGKLVNIETYDDYLKELENETTSIH